MRRITLALGSALALAVLALGVRSIGGESYRSKKIEAHFSPDSGIEQVIAGELRKAEKSIDVAIYAFTNKALLDGLITRSQNKAAVRVLSDPRESRQRWSKTKELGKDEAADIEFYTYLPPSPEDERSDNGEPAKFHHKFCIIDNKVVIAGSFNWTKAADIKNCEDIIIIRDKRVAAAYKKRFDEMWTLAKEQAE